MSFKMTLSSIMVVALTYSVSGCSSKKVKETENLAPDAARADENQGDSDSGRAMGLKTVNFGYDSYVLDSNAKKLMKDNIDILKDQSSIKIQVEGHCDERGGIQYNIALGEKRANSVKKFLADAGVDSDRVETISFGKERPLDQSHGESAWSKNRRANFVITSK